MRRTTRSRIAGVLALTTAGVLATAAPAFAASNDVHRGSSGCFSWSWADGWTTTTVYYHNTCSNSEQLQVQWSTGATTNRTVSGDGKGSVWGEAGVNDVVDMGRA